MTRRPWALALVGVLMVVATAVVVAARDRPSTTVRPVAPAAPGLALIVVQQEAGPLGAVVGTTGFGGPGVLVLPPESQIHRRPWSRP